MVHFILKIGKETISRLLIENQADVNAKSRDELSALMIAIDVGNENIIRSLIQHHADVNFVGQKRFTPLMISAQKGNASIIRQLVENGARITDKNINHETAIEIAENNGISKNLSNHFFKSIEVFLKNDHLICDDMITLLSLPF